MKYPYFEKDISNLNEKGYWINKKFNDKFWTEWEKKVRESNKDTY